MGYDDTYEKAGYDSRQEYSKDVWQDLNKIRTNIHEHPIPCCDRLESLYNILPFMWTDDRYNELNQRYKKVKQEIERLRNSYEQGNKMSGYKGLSFNAESRVQNDGSVRRRLKNKVLELHRILVTAATEHGLIYNTKEHMSPGDSILG